MNSFREAHGRLRGFAGVKRPLLAEKPKSNKKLKKHVGIGLRLRQRGGGEGGRGGVLIVRQWHNSTRVDEARKS